jgi:hypothetical protein
VELAARHLGRCRLHRKRELLALDVMAIGGGVNVGDALVAVEGLVMVSGSESGQLRVLRLI